MEWLGTVIASVCSLAAGIGGSWLLLRTKKVEKDADKETEGKKTEASAVQAFLAGQQSFNEYVERLVEQRVTAATADMQQEIDSLRGDMNAIRAESHEMNDAIRARETQLWLWNFRNRPGAMPELPFPILKRLGIAHLSTEGDLEDTEPTSPQT